MIYRTARLIREIVGVAIGGSLVVAGLVTWRLSAAPIEAQFIRPYLEQEINDAGLGFSVQVTEAKLSWRRFRPVLDLHFHRVSVLGQGGATVGAFKDGTVGLSVPNLLFGRPALIEIDIDEPEITIVRDGLNHFSMRVALPSEAAPPKGPDAAEVADDDGGVDFIARLQQLADAPGDGNPLGRLRRVRLVDGQIKVEDRKLGLTWSAPDVDIDIVRTPSESRAQFNLALAFPGHSAQLTGEVRYIRAEGKAGLSLALRDFDAAAAAPLAAMLAPLSALAVPVSGEVHAVIDRGGTLINADAKLHGGAGGLALPEYYKQPLNFQSLGLDLHFTAAPQRLEIDRLAIDLGDAKFTLRGLANFNAGAVAIDAHADFANIAMARLDAIWPQGIGLGARDWMTTHITDGAIKSGTVHIAATGREADFASLQPTSVDGVFDYSGLEVHYFPPLPPVRGITGHAAFDAAHMDLTIDSGALDDLAVTNGAITITGFDKEDRAIDIGLNIGGPLKTALKVLDSKPLGYAHDLGIVPDTVGGQVNARAKFTFPLVKDLYFRQIALSVKGGFDGVAVAGVIESRDLTDGALAMTLDKKGMTLSGKARLSGVPTTLDWQESFLATTPIRSNIAFHSELDDAARTALNILPPDIVTLHGIVAVNGTVTIDRARNTTLTTTADIAAAELTAEKFGLRKAAGEPGTADLSFLFVGDTLRRIPHLRVASKNLTVAGSVDFAPDGTLLRAEFPQIADRRNDYALSVDARRDAPHSFAISVKGNSFDATPLLANTASTEPPSHEPKLDLTVALDHVLTGTESKMDSVSGTVTLSGGRLDQADIKATAGGPVRFSYLPAGDALALHLTAADAGATLAALGLTRGVRGGALHLDGSTKLSNNPRLTIATLEMRDFRMVEAPIMAQLVNAVSITGFVDLLSGQGLGFDRLSTQMDYVDGKITFRDGRSAGALGISFEGDVDLDRDKIALKGTVVPANTLNSILAAIPVVGDIITGGTRGGLIGLTYSVNGTPNDPKVSVNPLSVFAPGFLRNLFFLGPSESQPKASPEAATPVN